MLIGFSFKNFCSYREETEFSMLGSNKTEYIGLNTIELQDYRVLKSSVIYGANGSGKSNFISALKFMKDMVTKSLINDKIIHSFSGFLLNTDSIQSPTSFEIEFVKKSIHYIYKFSLQGGKIIKETLQKKNRRMVLLFERNGSSNKNIVFKGEFRKAEKIIPFLRENKLLISILSIFNFDAAEDVIEWFAKDLFIITPNSITDKETIRYIQENSTGKDEVLKLLHIADFGINDFELINIKEVGLEEFYSKDEYEEEFDNYINLYDNDNENELSYEDVLFEDEDEDEDEDEFEIDMEDEINIEDTYDILTRHNIYDVDHNIVKELMLQFSPFHSHGTKKFFQFTGPILRAIKRGSVLVIDEIDNSMHCSIVRMILQYFNSIDINQKNAQLICTTHDVLLLDEDIRRDQIWFVDKNTYGESELYSLEEFKDLRKDDKKLRKYLLGSFGAVPNIGELYV